MSTAPSLALEQESYLALSVLAYMFVRMGQLERAERVYRVLAQAQPKDMQAHLGLALASLQRRQGEETLRHLDRVADGISDNLAQGDADAEQDSETARALRPLRTVLLLMRTEAAAVAAHHPSNTQSSREHA